MKLNVLKTIAALEAIGQEWMELLQASVNQKLHFSLQWFLKSYRIFHTNDQLYVLVIYGVDGQLNGIAPLVVVKENYRFVKLNKICFAKNPQNPSNDFIFRKGFEDDCLSAMMAHLCGFAMWRMIDLQMINESKATAIRIKEYMKQNRMPFGHRNNRLSPYIKIDGDWKVFWSQRSKKFKKSIRNKINKANNTGYIVEKIRFDTPNPEALADMLRISGNSWKREIGTDLSSKKDNWSFYRQLCDLYGWSGNITLYFLKIKGMRAAFEFHVEDRNVVYPIRADYDRWYGKQSPGSILEYEIIKKLFEKGSVKEYNSCGHTYKYLLNWTQETRAYINIEIFDRRSFAVLLHVLEFKILPWMRKHKLYRMAKEKLGWDSVLSH